MQKAWRMMALCRGGCQALGRVQGFISARATMGIGHIAVGPADVRRHTLDLLFCFGGLAKGSELRSLPWLDHCLLKAEGVLGFPAADSSGGLVKRHRPQTSLTSWLPECTGLFREPLALASGTG